MAKIKYIDIPILTARQKESIWLGGPSRALEFGHALDLDSCKNWDAQCWTKYNKSYQIEAYLLNDINALLSPSWIVREEAHKRRGRLIDGDGI